MMSFSADILPMLLQRPELYFKFIQKALLDNVLFGCGGAIKVLLAIRLVIPSNGNSMDHPTVQLLSVHSLEV